MEMWAADGDVDGKNILGVPVPARNTSIENRVFKRRPHMTTAKAMLNNTAKQYDWINPPSHYSNADINRNLQGWALPNVKNAYDLRQKMVIIDETSNRTDIGFVL